MTKTDVRITLTYSLAMAAAQDAGNRAMRKHSRTAWNVDDWNTACKEFERLYGKPLHSGYHANFMGED